MREVLFAIPFMRAEQFGWVWEQHVVGSVLQASGGSMLPCLYSLHCDSELTGPLFICLLSTITPGSSEPTVVSSLSEEKSTWNISFSSLLGMGF